MSFPYKLNMNKSPLMYALAACIVSVFLFSIPAQAGNKVPVSVDPPAESDKPGNPFLLRFAAPMFTESAPGQSGNPFPFNLPETFSSPTLADLNGDGLLDMMSGEEGGTILYFQNTGTAATPNFQQVTGESNPMDGVDIGEELEDGKTTPAFVDIDGDMDYDLVIGSELGTFAYYENTGSPTEPAFEEGATNPLNGVDVGNRSAPVFVDIDGDDDYDMVSGQFAGSLVYYENTGTPTAPAFTLQNGVTDPFSAVAPGSIAKPAFADMDFDDDYDLVISNSEGVLLYFENTGTPMEPTFEEVTGVNNPLDGFDAGTDCAPAMGDVTEGNGVEVVVGNNEGNYYYYLNADPLPVELTSFSAILNGDDVQLSWTTASETNNAGFEVQQSVSGSYQNVGWVRGTGTTTEAQSYSFTVSGVGYGSHTFRLKQVDFDGAFEYSGEETVEHSLEASYELSAVSPNPFNPQAGFELTVAREQEVNIELYDIQGRLISVIHRGALTAQTSHRFTIDGSNLASGKYLIRATGEAFTASKSVTLLK